MIKKNNDRQTNRKKPAPDALDRVQLRDTTVGDLARDVTASKQAENALVRSNNRFELLAYTAQELLQARNPQKIVETLCTKVMETLDCQAFFNFLVDEKAGKLHLNACAGIPREEALRLIKDLESQMRTAAKQLEFEKAAQLRDQIIEVRRAMIE